MATTTNFGWETPDDTDLVKDGALAMRTLGNAIDASLVDLKGGTTGQVLSKTSNTDMDFTWVTTDDADAIQNSIVDAKGDLITATAADTPARLAVGNNGETLVADSSASTGLRWQGNFAAGKNKFINGDFYWNQRNFTSVNTDSAYCFDRWVIRTPDTSLTVTPQTFTPGTAPVSGYEGANFVQLVTSGSTGATAQASIEQRIEDVRTFAGQTVTISFWAKAASGTPKVAIEFRQVFGTGGSSVVNNYAGQVTLSTSWTRYSLTYAMPSISGKTIGTSSYLTAVFWVSAGSNYDSRTGTLGIQNGTFQFWGMQVEAGNVATAFQTATGTLAGELSACQRYYQKSYEAATTPPTNTAPGYTFTPFPANATNLSALGYVPLVTVMRSAPTVTIYSYTLSTVGRVSDSGGGDLAANSGATANVTNRGFSVYNNSGGTINFLNGGFIFHWVASAEL